MKKIKKMSFNALIESISREDKKCILAGSGSVMNGSYNSSGGGGSYTGNMGYYASDRGMSSQFTPAGTLLYSPTGNYNSPPISSNQNSYGYGGNTYNTNNYGSGGNTLSNSVGWTNNGGSIKTVNQNDISRLLNFMDFNTISNKPNTWNDIAGFLNNELTAPGRAANDSLYGPIQLNNVNVLNKYKGPSVIPEGMVYENGVLTLGVTMGSHGVLVSTKGSSAVTYSDAGQTGTKAILIPFTKEELMNGFNKIGFSDMNRPFIEDWNPVTNQYDNATRFKSDMKLNVEGASVIALYEKLSLTIYDKDSNTGQNATIGFGHLIHPGAIKSGDLKSITFDQAVSFFASDIIETERALNQKIENMGLTNVFSRSQYFALSDMAYNAGTGSESNRTVTHQVLTAMKTGGILAANKVITDFYHNETGGVQDRRYFQSQAFINGRSITPEQAKLELVNLGIKK